MECEQLRKIRRVQIIIYYRGKIVGGMYDDRFLVKLTKSALEYI